MYSTDTIIATEPDYEPNVEVDESHERSKSSTHMYKTVSLSLSHSETRFDDIVLQYS